MFELARPVGIGLAACGEVADVVRWADDARRRGLHSVWIRDSLFGRDAVTYATAIAAELGNNGLQRAIVKIDIETAQLHAAFGLLYVIGLSLGHML